MSKTLKIVTCKRTKQELDGTRDPLGECGGKRRLNKNGKMIKEQSCNKFKKEIKIVLKQVHPELTISTKAMSIMNSLVVDMFERITAEASQLARRRKCSMIAARDIETAVKLELGGELAKHAVSAGNKALATYNAGK